MTVNTDEICLAFCKLLGGRSITEFNYRYFDAAMAQVFIGISSIGLESDRATVIRQLQKHGFQVTDMTANEVEGWAHLVLDEVVTFNFRFFGLLWHGLSPN